MLVVPVNKFKMAAMQTNVQCSAAILKRVFIFNTMLSRGMHDSWNALILKDMPGDISMASFSLSREIEKKLKISKEKMFNYPDPLQWLLILDDVDFHQFILCLGAFCWARAVKCVILKQQVGELIGLIGADLYAQILNNEMHEISTVYEGLFPDSLPKSFASVNLSTNDFLYQSACQLLAVVFVDQPLFFKIRLALRLPYSHALTIQQSKSLPILSPEQNIKLRQLMFQLLDKVSEQWQKWLA